MKLSTLWAAYEEVRGEMENIRGARSTAVTQKNIGSGDDPLARQWQRRNRLSNSLSAEIYDRILDMEEATPLPPIPLYQP